MRVCNEHMLGGDLPSFKDFFRSTSSEDPSNKAPGRPDPLNSRKQKGFTGMTRMRQNLVPDKDQPNPELVNKVEVLRNAMTGKQVLNAKDLQDILSIYKIKNLTPDRPRELGTTGITIYFDDALNTYCLNK